MMVYFKTSNDYLNNGTLSATFRQLDMFHRSVILSQSWLRMPWKPNRKLRGKDNLNPSNRSTCISWFAAFVSVSIFVTMGGGGRRFGSVWFFLTCENHLPGMTILIIMMWQAGTSNIIISIINPSISQSIHWPIAILVIILCLAALFRSSRCMLAPWKRLGLAEPEASSGPKQCTGQNWPFAQVTSYFCRSTRTRFLLMG